jgi:hypothetical protein
MLLLIYFNPVIGPDLLYSIPENVPELISEDDLDQIKRLMDSATPGFFTHAFSPELNTANYFFMLPSAWARGKQEMLMITKVIEEESPNLPAYESEFKHFVQKLKTQRSNLFKALYISNAPLNYEAEIHQEYAYLKETVGELVKFFSITQIQTHGTLFSFDEIKKKEYIPIPGRILRDLETFIEKNKNYFIVFQKRKDSFKIDIIPYQHERIVKIAVIFSGQLGPETLKSIGIIFQDLKLPLVFSSGICQQGGKCIYEVYLDPLETIDFEEVRIKLKHIKNVDEVKIVEIETNKA